RELLVAGWPPDTPIAMIGRDGETRLRSTVGFAGTHTIKNSRHGTPVLARIGNGHNRQAECPRQDNEPAGLRTYLARPGSGGLTKSAAQKTTVIGGQPTQRTGVRTRYAATRR